MKPPLSEILTSTTTSLHALRATMVPSNRELTLLLESRLGRQFSSLRSNELALARLVFAQVALMAGAALCSDSETFLGAERLWRDMQQYIGPEERALARHFLDVLSKDEGHTESERAVIRSLAEELTKADTGTPSARE